jgi:hypothetical protein
MNDTMILEQVRSRLSNGMLRRGSVSAVVAGYGAGTHDCAACGRTIRSSEVAYRLHFGPTSAAIQMHYYCFMIWEKERTSPDVTAGELSSAVTRNSATRLRMDKRASSEVFRRF